MLTCVDDSYVETRSAGDCPSLMTHTLMTHDSRLMNPMSQSLTLNPKPPTPNFRSPPPPLSLYACPNHCSHSPAQPLTPQRPSPSLPSPSLLSPHGDDERSPHTRPHYSGHTGCCKLEGFPEVYSNQCDLSSVVTRGVTHPPSCTGGGGGHNSC